MAQVLYLQHKASVVMSQRNSGQDHGTSLKTPEQEQHSKNLNLQQEMDLEH